MFGNRKNRHPHPSFVGSKGMVAGAAFRGFAYLPMHMVESPSSKKSIQKNLQETIDRQKEQTEQKTSRSPVVIKDQYETNYYRHQELIDEFITNDIENLRKKINNLPVLIDPPKSLENAIYNNIPESKGNNLFYLIIFNASLPSIVKKELLNVLIFQRGYDKWAIQLFHKPFYEKLLENGLCFQLLEDIYIKSFLNKNILSKETENHFLIQCFQNSRLCPLDFYNMQSDGNKKFQLLSNWINSQTETTEIITIYNTIRQDFGLSNDHLNYFLKMAKQKILDIEIKNPGLNPEDEEQVRDFLDINRNKWTSCFACFFTRCSVNIHTMIQQGNIAKARNAWDLEEKGLTNFYSQYGLR